MTNENSDALYQYYPVGTSRSSCKLTYGSQGLFQERLETGGTER